MVPIVVRGPKLCTGFVVQPHQPQAQGDSPCPGPLATLLLIKARMPLGFLAPTTSRYTMYSKILNRLRELPQRRVSLDLKWKILWGSQKKLNLQASSAAVSTCLIVEHHTVVLKLLVPNVLTGPCSFLTPQYPAELCIEQRPSDATGRVTCGLPKLSPRVMPSFVMWAACAHLSTPMGTVCLVLNQKSLWEGN